MNGPRLSRRLVGILRWIGGLIYQSLISTAAMHGIPPLHCLDNDRTQSDVGVSPTAYAITVRQEAPRCGSPLSHAEILKWDEIISRLTQA